MEANVLYNNREYKATHVKTLFNQPPYRATENYRKCVKGTYTIMFIFFIPALNIEVKLPIHHVTFISEENDGTPRLGSIIEKIKIAVNKRRNYDLGKYEEEL